MHNPTDMTQAYISAHCTSTDETMCPWSERLESGMPRYTIGFYADSYKFGYVVDNLTHEVYADVRKPDEACSHFCSIVGCPVRAEIQSLWEE